MTEVTLVLLALVEATAEKELADEEWIPWAGFRVRAQCSNLS